VPRPGARPPDLRHGRTARGPADTARYLAQFQPEGG
jgi:hypothetical protein